MNQTALTFGPTRITTLTYRSTSLQVTALGGGGTRLDIVQRASQSLTTVNVLAPGKTVLRSAIAGPQGVRGETGDGINTYDYDLATLYRIGKL